MTNSLDLNTSGWYISINMHVKIQNKERYCQEKGWCCESILYLGAEEEHHRGVGLILKREVRRTLLKLNPVNERIMTARFNSLQCFAKLTVIQVYAPTNDAEDESKEEFYEQLQWEVEATLRHDVLIVMGDLNAKIGEDNEE